MLAINTMVAMGWETHRVSVMSTAASVSSPPIERILV
jgi:hypothetical protein